MQTRSRTSLMPVMPANNIIVRDLSLMTPITLSSDELCQREVSDCTAPGVFE
jgi:hypothetical protein